MRYWFDTEFIDDGKTIDLISIGIVAEDGRELYLLNYDCDHSKASDWVKENVLVNLPEKSPDNYAYANEIHGKYKGQIALQQSIIKFCNPKLHGKPEFWAYYADYDWVVFCQLFGTMMDLPDGFPMYCLDLKQEMGDIEVPKQTVGEHNALEDARWVKTTWKYIQNKKSSM